MEGEPRKLVVGQLVELWSLAASVETATSTPPSHSSHRHPLKIFIGLWRKRPTKMECNFSARSCCPDGISTKSNGAVADSNPSHTRAGRRSTSSWRSNANPAFCVGWMISGCFTTFDASENLSSRSSPNFAFNAVASSATASADAFVFPAPGMQQRPWEKSPATHRSSATMLGTKPVNGYMYSTCSMGACQSECQKEYQNECQNRCR